MAEFNIAELMKGVSRADSGREQISYLPHGQIFEDAANGYSMDGIGELARSIEIVGLQQPLRVRPIEGLADGYRIISGHRRFAAVTQLIEQGSQRFADGIPCIIDSAAASDALRELQLILGNADNRKLTAADELQQTERISDCLRRLEDEGYQFPGRHRDWVSKLSGLSRSKIGRLEAIIKHLSPVWKKLFDEGKLGETVAYALQKLPADRQDLLYSLCINAKPRVQPASLIELNVNSFAKGCANADNRICRVDGSEEPCFWKTELLTEGYSRPGWVTHYGACSNYHDCARCCAVCDRLAVCSRVCPKLKDKAAEQTREKEQKEAEREKRLQADMAERREKEAAQRKAREAAETAEWKRIGARRRALGLDIVTAYNLEDCELDENEIAEIEDRETGLTFGLSFWDAVDIDGYDGLCELADRLQCSVDWLLGRVADPQPVSSPSTTPGWHTGEPETDGPYWCEIQLGKDVRRQGLRWSKEQGWLFLNVNAVISVPVLRWYPLPKEDEK